MPNHIVNRIEVIGTRQQIKSFFERFNTHHKAKLDRAHDGSIICENKKGEVGWFHEQTGKFDRREKKPVVGIPKGFEIQIQDAVDHFPDFNKVIPQPENIFNGDLSSEDEERCKREGRPTWYDWNCKNWGTKWNSYSNERPEENIFEFQTAWAGVPEIIRTMSEICPDVEIYYEYSDEDTGHNCGRGRFKAGIGEIEELEGGSNEAYELAFKLRPDRKEDYQLINGKYEYVEKE